MKYLTLFLLLLVLSSCASDGTNVSTGAAEPKWSLLSAGGAASKSQWSARYGHAVVLKDGAFFLFGGESDGTLKNDVWKSTDGTTWIELTPSAAWAARIEHQVVVKDGAFFLFGGLGDQDSYKNDVWKWSGNKGDAWTQGSAHKDNPTDKWTARDEHQVVLKDGSFFLFGGESDGTLKNDVWKWSGNKGDPWTQVSAGGAASKSQWTARIEHQVVVKDGAFFLFGGLGDQDSYKNDVWKWSGNKGDAWTQVSAGGAASKSQWSARYEHQVVLKDGSFYLFGGNDAKKRNDVWSSSDGKTWTQVSAHKDNPTDKWTARDGHAVVVKDGAFYLFGGYDGNHKNDVWVYK